MEYADDITKLTSDYNGARNYEIDVDVKLNKNGLKINNNKTKYTINRIRGKSANFLVQF